MPILVYNHIDGEERELSALLSLSSWCLVIVVWLFHSVRRVCPQFVIVILTFWVSFMRTAMALATFAWSSLSLRHSLKFSCGDSNGN